MCGIFGAARRLTDQEVATVKTLIDHRGPDSWGQHFIDAPSGGVHFVHTRLAIQDLSASGHQPMQSASGRWWLTFNGEIYNHYDLREELNQSFRGTSDTETLVEYLNAFGIDRTVTRLNGIFAFAAFDRELNVLYLVRDHFGIKPLYYCGTGEKLYFSSEIKPLLALGGGGGGINRAGLGAFLALRYIPSPETLLAGVHRLAPGHYLKVDLGSGASTTVCYVTPTAQRFKGTFAEAVSEYRRLLGRAVESQLLSDVPVGVLLSGGIDSAVVAAFAREKTANFHSFTVGFGEEYEDCEIEDARETARVLDIPHEHVTITATDLRDSLTRIFDAVEEPLGTTSIMPMWYLSKLARTRATVVLTGQGSDEPWGGYRRYQIEMLLARLPLLKRKSFRGLGALSNLFRDDAIRRGLLCLGEPDPARRFGKAYALFTGPEIEALGGPAGDFSTKPIEYWLAWLSDTAHLDDTERMMRIDTRMNLADDLLLYGDKVSMAFALEARVPMLDAPLIEFVESLPLGYRTSLRATKLVHKAMARSYLPATIVNRKKKGFQVPFGDWSRGMWRDYVGGCLLDPGRKLHAHIDRQVLERLWHKHQQQAPDQSRQMFALLMLSGWCETFL